jgi:predicted  nucleic acid-binding Zn-ribbon protein/predicted transcriptional regulator
MGVRSKIIEISRSLPEEAVAPHGSEQALGFADSDESYSSESTIEAVEAEPEFVPSGDAEYWEEEAPKARPWGLIAAVSFSVAAVLGWSAFFGWAHWQEFRVVPEPSHIITLIGQWSAPMILLALLWMLVMRNSSREATRFGDVAGLLRTESLSLEERMKAINGEISLARSFLAENARELDSIGRQSAQRLTDAAEQLGSALVDADEKSQLLAKVSTAAVTNLEQLRNHLPVVTSAAKDVTNQIGNAGRNAQSQIETLIPAIKLMDDTANEAFERLHGLTSKTQESAGMLDQVARGAATALQGAAVTAGEQGELLNTRIAELAAKLEQQLGQGGDRLTETIALQGENLASLLHTLQSEIDHKAEASGAQLGERLESLRQTISGAGQAASDYDQKIGGIIGKLSASITDSEDRVTRFEHDATDRMAQMAFAINALAESSEKLGQGLVSNEAQANMMLGGSEKLLLALDTASRELDDSLPAAFSRLESRFAATQTAFTVLLQDSKTIEDRTSGLCAQLGTLETMLTSQKSAFDNLVDGNDERLEAHRSQIETLASALVSARSMIADLSHSANDDVTTALTNIRQTTIDVAASTKAVLEGELGSIAETLSEQNRALLQNAVDDQVTRLNGQMQSAIERNIALSETASVQITRQLAQLDEMTSNLESRVSETRAQFAGIDDEGFARRMALLTESLNSAAIDVAKILSNDVTDTAWAAYLKGDRGVFTRRAVKLLDNNESKIVASYYDEDIEFREHVNRYIHDFESMMRVLLSTRDGNAVGITLLSSDVGKLYVALAQAIDRLRD